MGKAHGSMCWMCMVGGVGNGYCSPLLGVDLCCSCRVKVWGLLGWVNSPKGGGTLISSLSSISASFTLFVMLNRSCAACRRGRSGVAGTPYSTTRRKTRDKSLATTVAKM